MNKAHLFYANPPLRAEVSVQSQPGQQDDHGDYKLLEKYNHSLEREMDLNAALTKTKLEHEKLTGEFKIMNLRVLGPSN